MVKNLNYRGLSDRASLEIFHTVFSGQINGFHFGHWVRNLLSFFVLALTAFVTLLLNYVDLIAHEDFDWDLTGSLALGDPLLDSLKSRSLSDIEQVNDSCWAIDVFMHIFVMSLFPRHIEVDDLVLISIIDVKSRLF